MRRNTVTIAGLSRRPLLALLCLAVLFPAAQALEAEYTFFTPPGSFAVEVSLENSPYPRLPIYRNAITSLEVLGDKVVGGTSASPGLSPFLFTVSLSKRRLEKVVDLSTVISGQRAIQSGFGRGSRGTLYAGTMPDRSGDSGHLIEVRIENDQLVVKDLGIPIRGEGVFAVAADGGVPVIYGISHPSGKFFCRDLRNDDTRIFEETVLTSEILSFLRNYALQPEDVLSRRLILDRKGRVFGSMPVSKLFRYTPASRRIETLTGQLPEVWGRRPLGRVDAWAMASDGSLYGGNAGDGQLFRLDSESGVVINLGKPILMPRMKGLAFAGDGKLYGVGGAAPGYAHLFSYDPKIQGYVDLGNPRFTMTEPGLEQGISWRGFQLGTLAVSEDGRYVVMGEEEALSQLMVFPVK